MPKKFADYEPIEQSLLWLLRVVINQQAVLRELYDHSFDDFDQRRREVIQERMNDVHEAIDSALKALEGRAKTMHEVHDSDG